uniref:HTH myb-type domain-containing protein n=1 Tax=Fagus sylvatica TaxID=28930 RepID=A0A2N9FTW0_FAGSY
MASPSELTLDCKPHSYSSLLKSFGDQTHDQTQKLEEFLSRLEEERLKIDAFKRELPLCMQLLSNAVEAYRQQLQAYRANQGPRPVLEEFIPLKHSTSESSEKSPNNSDKANWMTSAQLWSQASDGTKPQSTIISTNKEPDIGFNVSPKLALDTKQRNGGAFHPFTKERNSCPSPTLRALPELALASAEKDMEDKKCMDTENGISCPRRENGKVGNGVVVVDQGKGAGNNSSDGQTNGTNNGSNNSQTHRKARRCWSPDLHRRFVNALQMLGGSQVATPKQIRELMKVDGLTNDEVKSHLQKYRLHTRRPSPSPQVTGAAPPQLVVLGGIWVPEYATAAAAHSGASALYGHGHPGSHAPQHYCASPVPQDYYAAAQGPPPPHHQLHHHTLHHQLHVYKAASQAHSSPESDIRGTGDRSESIEDGKSDSSSWKGESGERERKGLCALREDGEESNGSGITLKF